MRRPGVLAGLVLLLLTAPSQACSIPVFRYALEHWELAPYDLVVYKRGALTDSHQRLIDETLAPKLKANVRLHIVDLDAEPDARWQNIWQAYGKDQSLPWLVAQVPGAKATTPPLWSGALSQANVDKLLVSRVRRKTVERLARRDSAVFLLLQSGDAQADARTLDFLRNSLAALEKKITLPEPTPDGPQLKYDLPLKLAFTILTIAPEQAEEKLFVHMLRESDNLGKVKEPVVIPVFGRGRMLCSLHGDNLNEENLTAVAKFLCGPCSCQVKEQNPGVDLLITADWSELLDKGHTIAASITNAQEPAPVAEKKLTPVPPPTEVHSSENNVDVMAPKATPSTPRCDCLVQEFFHSTSQRQRLWMGAGIASLLVLITGFWALRSRPVPPGPGV